MLADPLFGAEPIDTGLAGARTYTLEQSKIISYGTAQGVVSGIVAANINRQRFTSPIRPAWLPIAIIK